MDFIPGGPAGVDAAVKDAIIIHKSLVTLTPTNHLKLVKVHTPAHRVDPAKLKGWYSIYLDSATVSLISQHFCCMKMAVFLVVVS
jgi:hypothetical protein